MSNALADLGASISIMPYSLYKILGLGSLKPIKITIEMADRYMQSPKGIKENVLVKISNFVFLVDFVILDIMEDENVPIILGRPMLATTHANIDVYDKKISLGVGNDQVVFNINKNEHPAFMSPICIKNELDKTQELDDLVMNDEKVGDFENYLSPEYGNHDIISHSPSELAEDKEDFSMTLYNPDKIMSIGLEEFVDIDHMWDDLDPRILSNEKAKTEFLKSGGEMQESDKKQGKKDSKCKYLKNVMAQHQIWLHRSIPINRGLIQAIPASLPPQPIRETTKASNLRRIPPGV
ncbi:putative reverse transcriptase, RNA-dependent DNA polymerase [Tanacetum coccineum]